MRRAVLIAGAITVATVVGVATRGEAEQGAARLTIAAVGADMEFRTLGLNPSAFMVPAGGRRVFQNLKPGRYVVVQAPPIGVATQVGENEWTIEGGLTIQCSDGVSTNQYDLVTGDDLTCTFTGD